MISNFQSFVLKSKLNKFTMSTKSIILLFAILSLCLLGFSIYKINEYEKIDFYKTENISMIYTDTICYKYNNKNENKSDYTHYVSVSDSLNKIQTFKISSEEFNYFTKNNIKKYSYIYDTEDYSGFIIFSIVFFLFSTVILFIVYSNTR